jgi:hypothetical protein
MSHHQHHQEEEQEKSYAYLYYVIGLFFGLYTGYVIDKDFIWIPIGGVLGLLTAAFFANVVAKSSEKH